MVSNQDNEFSENEIKQFENDIAYMQSLIDVYSWESCNLIRAYLTINGKMKAPQISEKIGLSGDKSVYKSLNRLMNAGFVDKELEKGSKRNAYYFIKNQLISDPEFTNEFIKYLVKKGQYQLISDYLIAANKASMGFLQVISDIMTKKIKDYIVDDDMENKKFLPNTIFYESIFSIENPELVINRIQEVLHKELAPFQTNNLDPRDGIPNPAALYFAFVPLDQSND